MKVFSLKLRGLYDLGSSSKSGKCLICGIGTMHVKVGEIEVHRAHTDVKHGAHTTLQFEVEARTYMSDELIRVAEIFGMIVVGVHNVRPVLGWQLYVNVVRVCGTVSLCIGNGVVGWGKHLCGNGLSARLYKLSEIRVAVVVLFLLQYIVLVKLVNLQFHRRISGTIIAVEVKPDFAGVAFYGVTLLEVSIEREHELLVGQFVVLKSMELCGKTGLNLCTGLGVLDITQIRNVAVAWHDSYQLHQLLQNV